MSPECPSAACAVEHPFKRCTCCGKVWCTVEDFLNDRHNRLDGYLYNSRRVMRGLPPEGLLIFTHLQDECGTSLAIPVEGFRDHSSPVPRRRSVHA